MVHVGHDLHDLDEFVEQRRRQLREHITDVELHQQHVDNEVDAARRASDKLIRKQCVSVHHYAIVRRCVFSMDRMHAVYLVLMLSMLSAIGK